MNYNLLFINQANDKGYRNLDNFYKYLHHYNMYDESEFISEQIAKASSTPINFGGELEDLQKFDSFLLVETDKKWNYTNVFGLDKEFIPTIEEIEMIRSSWFSSLSDSDAIITKPKFFKEEYRFAPRKNKTEKTIKSEEELKYCSVQKASLLLFDYYMDHDLDFRKKVGSENGLESKINYVDEIASRLEKKPISDIEHINSLKNSKNSKIAEQITNIVNKYCVTTIDWLQKTKDITTLGKSKGINLSLTKEELQKHGALAANGNPDIEKVYYLLEEKYNEGLKQIVIKEKEAKRLAEEKAQQEAQEKRDSELKKYNEIVAQAREIGLNTTIQFQNPTLRVASVFNYDNGNDISFKIASFDKNDNFIGLNSEEVNKFNSFVEAQKLKIPQNQEQEPVKNKVAMTRIDEIGDNQIDWKSRKPNYVNEFKYETSTPYPLRGRKQFVCWKTEWVESNKYLLDERKVPILDENGNKQLLPLYDKNGNVIYDENGKPVPDGKWTKVPFNPNVAYDPEHPWKSKAKSNDDRTWGTFEQACEAVRKYGYDGLGIMFGKSLMGIDIDHVIGPDGKLTQETQDIISTIDSYTEYSPSKTGVHILLFAELPENGRKRHGNLEMYDEGRFFTLTGDVVEGVFRKMTNKQQGIEKVKQVYEKYMPEALTTPGGKKIEVVWDEEPGARKISNDEIRTLLIAQGERRSKMQFITDYKTKEAKPNPLYGVNQELELLNGNWEKYFPSQTEADFALVTKIMFYTKVPKQVDEIFRDSNLMRDKWDELRGAQTYGQLTITKGLQATEGKKMYDPDFGKNKYQEQKQQNSGKKGMTM